jgi:hypothetical protein
VTPLHFTLPPQQARRPPIAAGVLLVLAVIMGALGVVTLVLPLALIAVLLVVVYFLVVFGSFSIFDEAGIHSKRGIHRHQVTWNEVSEVKLDPKSDETVMVYPTNGRPFKLGAPITGGLSGDPEYREKVTQIQEFVRAHIG